MMPPLTHRKALIARPAVPVCGMVFCPLATKEKIHPGLSAARPFQAEGPVLVVCSESCIVGPALGQNGSLSA